MSLSFHPDHSAVSINSQPSNNEDNIPLISERKALSDGSIKENSLRYKNRPAVKMVALSILSGILFAGAIGSVVLGAMTFTVPAGGGILFMFPAVGCGMFGFGLILRVEQLQREQKAAPKPKRDF